MTRDRRERELKNQAPSRERSRGNRAGTKIFQKSGTGGNREPKIFKNRERAGTGNVIFENHREVGNGRVPNIGSRRSLL